MSDDWRFPDYDDDEPIWHWIAVFAGFVAAAIIIGWAYMAVTG